MLTLAASQMVFDAYMATNCQFIKNVDLWLFWTYFNQAIFNNYHKFYKAEKSKHIFLHHCKHSVTHLYILVCKKDSSNIKI